MNKIKKLAQEIGVLSLSITIVFILVMGISVVKGWTEPTAPAPGGNLAAPINVGSIGQIKQGNLILNSDGSLLTGLTVNRDLEVINGAIHSTGDVCTDTGGGKCLGATVDEATCNEANRGAVRYRLDELQYCNGVIWKDVGEKETAQGFLNEDLEFFCVSGNCSDAIDDPLTDVEPFNKSHFDNTNLDGLACKSGWYLMGCWEVFEGTDNDIYPYKNGCVTNDFNGGSTNVELSIVCGK